MGVPTKKRMIIDIFEDIGTENVMANETVEG
jgi:hypothetical protein